MSLPPDPPLSTSYLNLFLKIYCPNNGGNYKNYQKQVMSYGYFLEVLNQKITLVMKLHQAMY